MIWQRLIRIMLPSGLGLCFELQLGHESVTSHDAAPPRKLAGKGMCFGVLSDPGLRRIASMRDAMSSTFTTVLLVGRTASLSERRSRPSSLTLAPLLEDFLSVRDWRAQLRHVGRQCSAVLCLRWFRSWARRSTVSQATRHLHCLRLYKAALEQQVRHIAGSAHHRARQDKLQHFEALTCQASEAWHTHRRPLEAITHLRWAAAKCRTPHRSCSGRLSS